MKNLAPIVSSPFVEKPTKRKIRSHKGHFKPTNPAKYRGNPTNIIYRSLWELKCMRRFDKDPNILEWSSEEIVIPYVSSADGQWHRYFPDFYVKVRERTTGKEKQMIIEIKPHSQVEPPKITNRKRVSQALINETVRWGINQSKWKAARVFCEKRGWEFKVMTEYDLGIKK